MLKIRDGTVRGTDMDNVSEAMSHTIGETGLLHNMGAGAVTNVTT